MSGFFIAYGLGTFRAISALPAVRNALPAFPYGNLTLANLAGEIESHAAFLASITSSISVTFECIARYCVIALQPV